MSTGAQHDDATSPEARLAAQALAQRARNELLRRCLQIRQETYHVPGGGKQEKRQIDKPRYFYAQVHCAYFLKSGTVEMTQRASPGND
jgi:hypothetical protein